MIVKKFDCARDRQMDSRLGTHSYSGWNTGYMLCDGTLHYGRWVGQGDFYGRNTIKPMGSCDGKTCEGAIQLNLESLADDIQRELGIETVVPDGKILVEEYSYNVQQYGTRCGYTILKAGEKLTPAKLREGTLLGDGEETKVSQTDYRGYMGRDLLVKNVGGEAVVTDHSDEIAAQKNFAREQIAKLMQMGFRNKAAADIMQAAGSERCVEGAEWAQYALNTVVSFSDDANRGAATDVLDMVLGGIGGTPRFRSRTDRGGTQGAGYPTAVRGFGQIAFRNSRRGACRAGGRDSRSAGHERRRGDGVIEWSSVP